MERKSDTLVSVEKVMRTWGFGWSTWALVLDESWCGIRVVVWMRYAQEDAFLHGTLYTSPRLTPKEVSSTGLQRRE